ncbi:MULTISPECIES: DUF3397 family protein [Lactobacillaceae]|uniref:DUF3397 family protein n=1 Tax=Lactobacillaceae TaxID=33958 RepID=UPI0014573484|nr:DUF3397 family protein [Lactobacillus sp. HBUAS51381]NLR09336.1 DUF3397 domain-containing protein [Lactobacillus sp. HBUAS51381]
MMFWTSPGGQLAILAIGFLLIRGAKGLLRRRWPAWLSTWDLMAPLFLLCALILIPAGAGTIMPWLVIGWMVIGIVVTLMQVIRNHEILYPSFFKTFWRLTDLYWLLGFVSCFLLVIS